MRTRIGIMALLALATLLVFSERLGCLSTALAKANAPAFEVSDVLPVDLGKTGIQVHRARSLAWAKNSTVGRYPVAGEALMAVAKSPCNAAGWLALKEAGWQSESSTEELIAFAVNYPQLVLAYRVVAARLGGTNRYDAVTVFRGKILYYPNLFCMELGLRNFLVKPVP